MIPESLSPGWESKFRIEYTIATEPNGTGNIEGYLYNQYGTRYRVRLQVLGLDSAGNVVARQIKQIPGELGSFQRDYFEFRGVPPAEKYLVTVFSYDPVEFDGHETK